MVVKKGAPVSEQPARYPARCPITVLTDIAASSEVTEAIARHQANGGVVVLRGCLYLDAPVDTRLSPTVRFVPDEVIFHAVELSNASLFGE